MRFVSWIFLALLVTGSVHAQTPRHLVLTTNTPEALVYADSVLLGLATSRFFDLPAQTRILRLVHAKADTWSVPPLERDLKAFDQQDTLSLALNFPHYYRIDSTPFGANVLLETPLERRLLGLTPLLYEQETPVRGTFIVAQDGYEPVRIAPGGSVWNLHTATLEPVAPQHQLSDEWLPARPKRKWLNAALVAASLGAGVVAIHFKTKADNRYDLYAVNGDPTLRPNFERYDRRAAVALGTMQVGVGVLGIRLILDK